jgi:hypothetical protein
LKSVAIAVLILCGSSAAIGADFCAVRVVVTSEGGSPAPALVELRDEKGATVERSLAPGGVAEFCDFEFGLYSIAIGGSTCGAIVIPNIRLRFGVTQVYRVYLNRCGGDSIPRGCSIYFRIADRDHQPLAGTSVSSSAIGGSKTTADSFGRAQVWIPPGTAEMYDFSKDGYASTKFEYACSKPAYLERAITMAPLGK